MAARKKAATPEPVAVTTICSVCGLPWLDHGKTPTTEDCIRLLKAELAKRPIQVPIPQPYPYPVRPARPWYWEEWYGRYPKQPYKITFSTSASKEATFGGQSFSERTPKMLETTCKATPGSYNLL